MKFLKILFSLIILISPPVSASVVYTTSFSETGQQGWWQEETGAGFSLMFLSYNMDATYEAYWSYKPLVGVPISIPRGATFDGISALLTNGELDAIEISIGMNGSGAPENVFFGGPFESRPTDFAGYHIDEISLIIERFDPLFPTDRYVPWYGKSWHAEGTISITVSDPATLVPEPTSLQLLLLGGLLLCFYIRYNVTRAVNQSHDKQG